MQKVVQQEGPTGIVELFQRPGRTGVQITAIMYFRRSGQICQAILTPAELEAAAVPDETGKQPGRKS